jgi:hypothetical protein
MSKEEGRTGRLRMSVIAAMMTALVLSGSAMSVAYANPKNTPVIQVKPAGGTAVVAEGSAEPLNLTKSGTQGTLTAKLWWRSPYPYSYDRGAYAQAKFQWTVNLVQWVGPIYVTQYSRQDYKDGAETQRKNNSTWWTSTTTIGLILSATDLVYQPHTAKGNIKVCYDRVATIDPCVSSATYTIDD